LMSLPFNCVPDSR